jgi:ABC-type Mn2+/Zn2+ transport system permease subunit
VALPQISAAGIAFAFLAYGVLVGAHRHGEAGEELVAMAGSFGFTLFAIAVLATLERVGRETVEARIGTAYAIAAAATILFLAKDPFGEAQMVSLLKGDILASTGTSLRLMSVVFGVVVAVVFLFRKQFLLVSFDRDMAIVLGMRVTLWDVLLYLAIGATISLGVMTAGPLVTFGFLVIPPLAARGIARRMISFSILAALIGGLSAFAGFYAAYRYDAPVGPSEVAFASVVLAVVGAAKLARQGARRHWARAT